VFTGDFGGWLVEWDASTGSTAAFTGAAHATQITAAAVDGGKLVTISMDDTCKVSSIPHRAWGDGIAMPSQPLSVAARNGSIVVGTVDALVVIGGNAIVNKVPVKFQAAAVAFNAQGTEVAAGGSDNNIYVYGFDGSKLTQKAVLSGHRGPVTSLEYNSSGELASTDANREVKVWRGETSVVATGAWVYHNSRIEAVSWSPDGLHLATVGNDSQIIVWDARDHDKKVIVKNAHQGVVKAVAWLDDRTLFTAGQDMAMKSWNVQV